MCFLLRKPNKFTLINASIPRDNKQGEKLKLIFDLNLCYLQTGIGF